jgi:hypothetical protein
VGKVQFFDELSDQAPQVRRRIPQVGN